MKKARLHSPDLTQDNIAKIREIFPGCVTMAEDESGEVRLAVDFDQLRQELSDHVVEGPQERYRLDWPGKREALAKANEPITKTLRPCREESVDFDTTENLFIEGDNLEALKLLQETYLGKVKMIYIDPPYNTGNDFLYKDDFAESVSEYMEKDLQKDAEGNRLVANTNANGRFHSDWLSFIYPRLKLARNLMRQDGVIFISIDDHEASNLCKVCDEIFGENNFIAMITREAIKGGSQSKNIRTSHDYVLAYARSIADIAFSGYEQKGAVLNLKDENGPYAKGRELNKWGAGSRREDSPSMWFPIEGPNGEDVYPIRNDGSEGRWRLGKNRMKKIVEEGNVIFEKRNDGTYIVYEKVRSAEPKVKQFTTIFKDKYINAKGTERVKKLFSLERTYFDYAKPCELVFDLMVLANVEEKDIVIDFFAGSSATADAVYQYSAKRNSASFIMVQLPEELDEKSEAFKGGYKTISDASKERIRLAGQKVLEGEHHPDWNKDIGFRVLKIDTSNMHDVYYQPDQVAQSTLLDSVDNIKSDRTPEDLLFQVLVDWGVDLTLPIREEKLQGKTVFFVDDNALAACFDRNITEDFIRELAKREPIRAVFRDNGFASDAVKVNVEQIFRQISPNTEIRAI